VSRCPWHRSRPRRVFWRVYLYGVVLLVAVAASIAVAGHLLWEPPRWAVGESFGRYAQEELSPLVSRPEELEAKLAQISKIFDVDVVVYRADGTRVASAGDELPGPLDQVPTKLRFERRGRSYVHVVPLSSRTAYLVVHGTYQRMGPRGLFIFGVVLAVLALVSVPFARGIVRPIERVTQTARALGDGDLAARTGIDRQDEVGALARAFDDMAARLEQLVRSEKELLANVSHELRTPLARIRVAIELVEEGAQDSPDQDQHLRGIAADLAELDQLMDQVLTTARLDRANGPAGQLPLEREIVALGRLIEGEAARFAEHHPDHRLELFIDAELPEPRADPKLLSRVLRNLLDNAAKYAEPDAGPVELHGAVSPDGRGLDLSVRDRGIGVDDSDLARLFEPFFRTDRSRERGTGGMGLGLALCRRIVEAHGGQITASAHPQGGLIVELTLPLD
jgi:signal transduction histidine kinase